MNKDTMNEIVKPIVVLSVIALVVSAVLAVVNSATAPVIAENEKATTLAAYLDVLPTVSDATTLEEVTDFESSGVEGVVKSTDGCYAIKAVESGFDGGALTVIVGFDPNGQITGTWVDATTQTAGVGSHVSDDEIKNQFVGIDGTQPVAIGENGLDARTGATISSKALFAAVNDCINCYSEVALGKAATVVEEFVNPTKEEAIEALAPGATQMGALPSAEVTEGWSNGDVTVFVAAAAGMDGDVPVAVAFDASGVITGIWVDASGETQGIGTLCMEPAFTSTFAGAASAADVEALDALSGATVTSTAVKTAVEACISGFAAM